MNFFVALAIGLILSFSVQAESQRVDIDTLVDHFNAVAFIHEHGKTGREAKPLLKWASPVRFSPSGTLTKEQVKHLFAVMSQIKKLTGLDVQFAKKGTPANMVIYFVPQEELAKTVAKGINCYSKIEGQSEAISHVRAYIPSDRPDKTNHCIVEETVQAFGLINDSDIIADSIFNEASTRTSMSVSDQILLKALYDSRLLTGMTRQEAQPLVKTVITEIIQNALDRKATAHETTAK